MRKIYVVGIGPGNEEFLTVSAKNALADSDIICGYTVYVDLVKDKYMDKKFIATSMKKEIDRCKLALDEADKGNIVAMICSGDAGVYGMAGLIYQLSEQYEDMEIEVVAGVTAALSGAAVLGAPLTHDFCVISLSDLLTEWKTIEKRLQAAAMGDFCIAIYNPRSKKRHDYLYKACEILMQHKSKDTVCAYVRNIGRQGQDYEICTLDEMKDKEVDMFSTVFIGNENTKIIAGKMVTPRGYEKRDESLI